MLEQEKKISSVRVILIEMVMFFTYAFFAVNWIAGSTLTPQIMEYFDLQSFASATFISNAITIAMLIVGPVIHWMQTWQYSMAFFAAISAVLFIAWPIVGQDFELNRSSGADTEKYTIGDALKEKINWFLPLTYSGLLTFYIVLLNIFPISGVTAINSKTLSILVAVGGVVGSVLAIMLSKVYFKRLPVIRWSGLAMTLFGVLMFNTKNGMLSMIAALAIGVLMFLPITSLVMIPQELPNMSPAKLTTIMGLFWALSYVIESVVFYLIGIVIDKSGYSAGLTIALVMSATFFLGSFLLPETGRIAKEKKK